MQGTSSKARGGSPKETPKKVSPRPARQLKLNPVELTSPSSSSNHTVAKTPKDKTPKVAEHKSPISPVSEKKRPSKLSQLESQITQLQEDLKKVKDRLVVSETSKRDAQEDAEQVRKELEEVSLKLEESQKQLTELVSSREASLAEIQNISQEKDREWESQIESARKQHSLESIALKSANDEIQKLKHRLEMVAESRDENGELQSLKANWEQARILVENMKTELKNSKESEEQAHEMVRGTLHQLEVAKETVNTLRSEASKSSEAYNSIVYELEKSKTRVNILEGIVSKLNADLMKTKYDNAESIKDDQKNVGDDVNQLKSDIGQLKAALEAADMRYEEEQTHKNDQMKNACELLEEMKAREAELQSELRNANANIEELKANLMDKETELQGISEENENLNMRIEKSVSCLKEQELETEVKKLREDVGDMKEHLMDKETELQNILEENRMLKLELKNREMNKGVEKQQVTAQVEASRAAEKDAMTKLNYMSEEIDNSKRKTARVTEQLEAAQKANAEMEAELRRLKVQSDQWRKAAEAAASMLSPGSNGKYVERTGSMPSYSPIAGKLSSPYLDDYDEDDTFKKKNGNVLKKIGVLWKKPQK